MKEIKEYSLLPHNTFGMDVKASVFVEYGSVAELKAWNNLNTDIIFVNQSLKLAATTSSTQTTAPTTSAPEASGTTYTVQKGDTLYSIAKKKGVSLAALIEANDMTSNVIYVGQVITF